MLIYIEDFLIQNILINYCLLRLVELTTKAKTKFVFLLFSSVIGAVFSVISAIFFTNYLIINIVKFSCALLMIFIAFKGNFKTFIFNFILLFIYTYALGGAIISLTGSGYQTNFGVVVKSKISLELVVVCVIILTYAFQLVAKQIKRKFQTSCYIYEITIILGKNKLTTNAYLDSGNLLNYKGEPVVIVNLDSFCKLTHSNLINYCLNNMEQIKTSTVNGCNNLKLFTADKLIIKNGNKSKVIKNQHIAVTNNFNASNYSALISPQLI